MTLKEKYPNYELVHFIEMYDDLISIEIHSLNAVVFEDEKYIGSILKEINELELNNEVSLILNFMKLCGWTNENEISVTRIKKELESVKNLSNDQ